MAVRNGLNIFMLAQQRVCGVRLLIKVCSFLGYPGHASSRGEAAPFLVERRNAVLYSSQDVCMRKINGAFSPRRHERRLMLALDI
jgi:hypothetical protein